MGAVVSYEEWRAENCSVRSHTSWNGEQLVKHLKSDFDVTISAEISMP